MILALDTATRFTGLALFDGNRTVVELNWVSANAQTTELGPRVHQLLTWQGIALGELSAVAVSLGPGSFTGLRVALSLAKGMALAHRLPLVGVPTLDATALPFLGPTHPVCAVVQAGRGRVCWALYGHAALPAPPDARYDRLGPWAGWRTPYALASIGDLLRHITMPTRFAGELSGQNRQVVVDTLGSLAVLPPAGTPPRRAGDLAVLGWSRLQAGHGDDVASLSPIYLHEP